jgi:hypothetical protein
VASGSDPEAVALLERAREVMGDGPTEGTYRVEVIRPDWQRTIRFDATLEPEAGRFRMVLRAPRKSAGTEFRKDGDRLTMTLPKLDRTLVISPAMLQDPWMGTDFTHRDLLDLETLRSGYEHRVTGREAGPEGEPVVVVESTALPEAPVTARRLEQRFRPDGTPLRVDYYDCEGRLLRTLRFEDVRPLAGRPRPSRWVMQPAGEPGHRTEVVVESLRRLDAGDAGG